MNILRDQRCRHCNKLLLRGMLFSGMLEIRCPRCKTENTVHGITGPVSEGGGYHILYDFAGKIIDADEGASEVLGYSHKELVAMHREDLKSDITPQQYLILREIVARLGSVAFDSVHQKKDGTMIPVKLTIQVLASEQGQMALLIGRPLVLTSRANTLSINPKGEFTYLSLPVAKLLRKPWLELLGKPAVPWLDLIDPGSFERHLLEKRAFEARGDSLRWVFHPVRDSYGSFTGYDVIGLSLL